MLQVVAILNVHKDSQLVLLSSLLPRQTPVRAERGDGDALLSGAKCKEDTSHRRNVHFTTNSLDYVLLCVSW